MESPSQSAANGALTLAYQKSAMEKLLAVAKARFAVNWQNLPFRPRTNTLVIGPSGTGKTYLVRQMAQELDLPFMHLSVSEWIVLGAGTRGFSHTWPLLIRFLSRSKLKPGAIIFLDEIDKLRGDSSWDCHLRNEVYRLLDLQLPASLDDEVDESNPEQWLDAQRVLANRTLIVAGGAFQPIWDRNDQPTVGFNHGEKASPEINVLNLVETLERELVNRFRTEIIVLRQLTKDDYVALLEEAQSVIPAHLRVTFLRLGYQRLHEAVAFRKGCRFIEELLLDAVIAERSMLFSTTPITSDISEEANTHV